MSFRNYATLIPFFVAVVWMIYRGFSAKRDYLRRTSEQQKGNNAASNHVA